MVLLRWLTPAIALAHASAAADVDCSTAASAAAGRDLTGQVVVMTGGDTGLGLETSKALAAAHATLVIGAYNATHGAEIAAQIAASTGNAKVSALGVDLSDLRSVRAFAGAVLAGPGAAGVATLVNDAGIDHTLVGLPAITADGFERVFQVNYLGPFLLTELLLPALRKHSMAAAGAGGARVINVASAASFDACLWGNRAAGCLAQAQWHTDATTPNGTLAPVAGPCGPPCPNGCNQAGTPVSNYGLTKFSQVAHAAELDAREAAAGSGVRAFSLHPGFVATPMTEDIAPATAKAWCAPLPYKAGVCPIPVQAGAATQTFLASAMPAELAAGAGQYYVQCKPTPKATYDGWTWGANASAAAYFDASRGWLGLGA